jgi:glycine hydroxymethyltransferase
VYQALLNPGDTVLAMRLDHGGHLTHGSPASITSKIWRFVSYGVSARDDGDEGASERIDFDEVRDRAKSERPRLIVAGATAYPRVIEADAFREIADEVGALLMVDMAHFAGLVAAGLHPNPVEYADVVTTTTHKTLGGPRAGTILCREEHAKKIDSAVFPGQQGGPLEHVIAAKAVAFRIAATELFAERQRRTVEGARELATQLLKAGHGVNVLTGGTDVHLVLVDLRDCAPELTGRQAEDRLHEIQITVNRNAVPFDPRPPMEASGLRIGTPALATRGLQRADFQEVGEIIAVALTPDYEARAGELAERVAAIVERYPLYEGMAATATPA